MLNDLERLDMHTVRSRYAGGHLQVQGARGEARPGCHSPGQAQRPATLCAATARSTAWKKRDGCAAGRWRWRDLPVAGAGQSEGACREGRRLTDHRDRGHRTRPRHQEHQVDALSADLVVRPGALHSLSNRSSLSSASVLLNFGRFGQQTFAAKSPTGGSKSTHSSPSDSSSFCDAVFFMLFIACLFPCNLHCNPQYECDIKQR